MPVLNCECGVLFYSSKSGMCPQCMYEEFDATPNEEDHGNGVQSLPLSGPREDLMRSVLYTLGKPVLLEKLTSIVYFTCKYLEARHVMPPFYFGMSRIRQKHEIIAALANIEHVNVAMTQFGSADRIVSIGGMSRSDKKGDDIDREIKQLVGVLKDRSVSEIKALLHLHFPQTVLEGGIGRTGDDIRWLFPSSGNGSMP